MRRFTSVFALKKRDSDYSATSSTGSVSTPDDDRPVNNKRSWKIWLAGKRAHPRPLPEIRYNEVDVDSDDEDVSSPPCSLAAPSDAARALQCFVVLTQNSLIPPTAISPFHTASHGSIFPRSINVPHVLPRPSSLRVKLLKSRLLRRYSDIDSTSSSSNLVPILPLAKKHYLPLMTPSDDFPDISRPLSPAPKSYPASSGLRRWVTRPCFEERCQIYLPSHSGIETSPISASFAIAAIEYSPHLDIMAVPEFFVDPSHSVLQDVSTIVADTSTQLTLPQSPPLSVPAYNAQTAPSATISDQRASPPLSAPVESATPTTPLTPPSASSAGTVKRVVRFVEDDGDSSDDAIPLHLVRQRKLREQKAIFIRQERLRRAREQEEEQRKLEREGAERERRRAILESEWIQAEKERREKEQSMYAEEVIKARMRRELQRTGGVPALVKREKETGELSLGVASTTPFTSPGERNKPHPSNLSSAASVRGVQAMPLSSPPNSGPTRKDASDYSFQHLQTPSASDSSPSNSRPSSWFVHSPTTQNNSPLQQEHSRPASTYSSSSESVGRRNSAMMVPMLTGGMTPMMGMQMQMPPFALPTPMIMTYPTFAASNPNLSYSPTVPSFQGYMANGYDNMMQMPLLPPTAPFMKQSLYDRRQRSSGNASGSGTASPASSPSSRRGSLSSSPERLVPMNTGTTSRNKTGANRSSRFEGTRKFSEPGWGGGLSSSGHPTHPPTIRSSSVPAPRSSRGSVHHSTTKGGGTAIPPVPPLPSPWTGVPTAKEMQEQMQMQDGEIPHGQMRQGQYLGAAKGSLRPGSQARVGFEKSGSNMTSMRGSNPYGNPSSVAAVRGGGGGGGWRQNQVVIS